MNKNFSLKFKLLDIIVIVTSILVSSSLMVGIFLYNKSLGGTRYLNIYHNQQELTQYHINIDELEETYTIVLKKDVYENLLGDFYIDVDKNKGIRVRDVTCPNLTCEKEGWVNLVNLPIVCIPNDVRVVITSTNTSEGDETLGLGGAYYVKHF